MLTRNEMLLVILGEECSEIHKECSKSIRFGTDHVSPYRTDKLITNGELIVQEICDFMAVVDMLKDAGVLEDVPRSVMESMIQAKKDKVEKFLKFSQECGTME